MLKSVMITLAVTLISLQIPAQAQTSCNPTEREACKKALKEADDVIRLQGDLLTRLSSQNEELSVENEELAKALVEVKEIYDSELKDNMVIGGAGILLGILVGVLIPK